jgi:Fn3-like domain from Purple Acid Phosphatase
MRAICAGLVASAALLSSAVSAHGFADADPRLPRLPFDGARSAEHPVQLINFPAITSSDTPSFEITYSPSGPFQDGDFVTVSVRAINGYTPDANDWVALYSPYNVSMDTRASAPLRYQFLDAAPSYLQSGVSNLRFQLTNVRFAMGFIAFSGGLKSPSQAGVSAQSVVFSDPNAPLGGRVVPTGDPDQLKILWSGGLTVGTPVVKWWPVGASPSSATVVAATPKQLTKDMLCAAPATSWGFLDLGYHFEAVLTGLTKYAGQRINYQYGDSSRNVYSTVAALRVPSLPGDSSKPTHILAFQDFGRGTIDDSFTWHEFTAPALNTTKYLVRDLSDPNNEYSAIFLTGDISYGMGYLNGKLAFKEFLGCCCSASCLLHFLFPFSLMQSGPSSFRWCSP